MHYSSTTRRKPHYETPGGRIFGIPRFDARNGPTPHTYSSRHAHRSKKTLEIPLLRNPLGTVNIIGYRPSRVHTLFKV